MSTSLYNPMTVLGKTAKSLEHPYKGKVVEVDSDPQHLGRIKVSIPELYGDYQDGCEGTLPWIYPRYFGKFNNFMELDVPEKGEIVEIIFPYKNIYLGYYTNKPIFKDVWDKIAQVDADLGAALKQVFTGEHYPNVYGKFDRNLTGWYVDKVTDEIFFVQGTTKASLKLDTEGSLHVNVPKSMYIHVAENIEVDVGLDVISNIGQNLTTEVGTMITTHSPDAQVTIDNTVTFSATEVNSTITTTNNTGDINNTGNITNTGNLSNSGTLSNTGAATIQGGVTGNGVVLETHTHKVPQSPSGVNESEPPTK